MCLPVFFQKREGRNGASEEKRREGQRFNEGKKEIADARSYIVDSPENWPLAVRFCLECQDNEEDENRRYGEAQEIPDQRRQPVADRTDAADELRMFGFVGPLLDYKHDERTGDERQSDCDDQSKFKAGDERFTRCAFGTRNERPRQRVVDGDNATVPGHYVAKQGVVGQG